MTARQHPMTNQTTRKDTLLLSCIQDYYQSACDSRKEIDKIVSLFSFLLIISGCAFTAYYKLHVNVKWLSFISFLTLTISFFTVFFSHHTSEKTIVKERITVTKAFLQNESYTPGRDKITHNLNKASTICFSIGAITMLSFLILNTI